LVGKPRSPGLTKEPTPASDLTASPEYSRVIGLARSQSPQISLRTNLLHIPVFVGPRKPLYFNIAIATSGSKAEKTPRAGNFGKVTRFEEIYRTLPR
jgi:hypothetical protein